MPLDLQLALRAVYDIFAYDELLDYALPPPGPLSPSQAAWIEGQLRLAGKRKSNTDEGLSQ